MINAVPWMTARLGTRSVSQIFNGLLQRFPRFARTNCASVGHMKAFNSHERAGTPSALQLQYAKSVLLRPEPQKTRYFSTNCRDSSNQGQISFSSRAANSNETKSQKMTLLNSRSLIQVSGKDAAAFLQGLITNDIHLLDASEEGGPLSIYAMVLNTQGRVNYDLIIYKTEPDCYLLEHDVSVRVKFLQHLKMYKLRKQLSLEDVSGKYKVYVGFHEQPHDADSDNVEGVINFVDPRTRLLGSRFYVESNNMTQWQGYSSSCSQSTETDYRRFRYKLGLAEGSTDLPPGDCFPLESNLDYLYGVHFRKGCYLGQELTARTHHTGVVRKRIMPIVIDGIEEDAVDQLDKAAPMTTEHGDKCVSVGKLRAHIGQYGIAVLRISEALAADVLHLTSGGRKYVIRAVKPNWWPKPD